MIWRSPTHTQIFAIAHIVIFGRNETKSKQNGNFNTNRKIYTFSPFHRNRSMAFEAPFTLIAFLSESAKGKKLSASNECKFEQYENADKLVFLRATINDVVIRRVSYSSLFTLNWWHTVCFAHETHLHVHIREKPLINWMKTESRTFEFVPNCATAMWPPRIVVCGVAVVGLGNWTHTGTFHAHIELSAHTVCAVCGSNTHGCGIGAATGSRCSVHTAAFNTAPIICIFISIFSVRYVRVHVHESDILNGDGSPDNAVLLVYCTQFAPHGCSVFMALGK